MRYGMGRNWTWHAHNWSSLNISNPKWQWLFPLAPPHSLPVLPATAPVVFVDYFPLSLSCVPGLGIQPRLKPVGILPSLDISDSFMAVSDESSPIRETIWFCCECQDKDVFSLPCSLDLNLEVCGSRGFWWSFFSHEEREQVRNEWTQRKQKQDTEKKRLLVT